MCAKQDTNILTQELQLQTKQSLNQTQRLMMSVHMQQAIRLLQLPLAELEPFLEEQVVLNPLLELDSAHSSLPEEREEEPDHPEEQEIVIDDRDLSILMRLEEDLKEHLATSDSMPIKRTAEEDKRKAFLENSIYAEPSLYEHLIQQAQETIEDPKELEAAQILIGYLDGRGFLTSSLEEVGALHHLEKDQLEKVLKAIQTFEPYGVGARSIQESLLIQLACQGKKETLAYRLVRDYYDELLHNYIPLIQKDVHCSYEQIQKAIEEIAKLDLHPGASFTTIFQTNRPLVPDVTLRQEGEKLIVDVERDVAPALRLNRRYLKLLDRSDTPANTKAFIRRHLCSARWLARNLQQRYTTIERIAEVLAKKQYAFFMEDQGKLAPLTMKEVAEELGVHESTIARTVAHKYINSPRGLLPLRTFFTTKYVSEDGEDLSSRTVKEAIHSIIAQEDKRHPLSDEKISLLLKKQGIPCARRTVAKYRVLLNIANTQKRKKFFTPCK